MISRRASSMHQKMMTLTTAAVCLLSVLSSTGVVVSAFSSPLSRFRQRRAAQKVQDNLLTRRTIQSFEPNLPEDWELKLEKALEAAVNAPNHKRTEPWRFHLLKNQSIRNVCELNARLVTEKKGAAAGDKKLKRWLNMPGWLVVTCRKNGSSSSSDDDNNNKFDDPMSLAREDYAACCCAVQNLCLSLHAQGMGTKWTTGPVNFHPDFSKAVGFDAQEEYVVGTIWFGTPAVVPSAPVKKMSLENVLVRHD